MTNLLIMISDKYLISNLVIQKKYMYSTNFNQLKTSLETDSRCTNIHYNICTCWCVHYNKIITSSFSRVGGLSFTSPTLIVTVSVPIFPPGWPLKSWPCTVRMYWSFFWNETIFYTEILSGQSKISSHKNSRLCCMFQSNSLNDQKNIVSSNNPEDPKADTLLSQTMPWDSLRSFWSWIPQTEWQPGGSHHAM